MIGTYTPSSGWGESFLYEDGHITPVTYGGASYDTALFGINDSGVLAGTFDFYSYGLIGWPCEGK